MEKKLKWKGRYSKKNKISDPTKSVDRSWIPESLKVECFKCQKNIVEVNYVVVSKGYSRKNNYEYWFNLESNDPMFWKDKEARKKDRQICNECLLKLFHDKETFWETVKDPKKKKKLGVYIFTGMIE